jgi:hypothetical protein
MTGNLHCLQNKTPYHQDVLLADGSISQSKYIGDVEMQLFDRRSQESTSIILKNCLYVPGFRNTLWSVIASNQQGHRIIFDLDKVIVYLHADQPSEKILHIAPPFSSSSTQSSRSLLPLSAHVAEEVIYTQEFHDELQSLSLTCYWLQKRNVLLELKSELPDHPDHPLVQDLYSSSYFHLDD